MAQRGGGVNKGLAIPNDYYFCSAVADGIFDKMEPHYTDKESPRVLDACSNDGVLGMSFWRALLRHRGAIAGVFYQDVCNVDDGLNIIGGCILEHSPEEKYDYIICNPPWKPVGFAERVYHHLLSLLADGGVLIFIIDNTFRYQGWKRAINLKWHFCYDLPRYCFDYGENKMIKERKIRAKNPEIEKVNNTVLLDACIMIYHNGRRPYIDRDNWFLHIDREVCV